MLSTDDRAAIEKLHRTWLDAERRGDSRAVLQMEIENLEISGSGSLALKVAAFRTTVKDPAAAGQEIVAGSHAWLLRRDHDGTWRVSVVTWTIA